LTPSVSETKTGQRRGLDADWPQLVAGDLIGGSDYTYMIYSSTRIRWWPLHGRKKHKSSSPTTMADGSYGAAVRRPTLAKAR